MFVEEIFLKIRDRMFIGSIFVLKSQDFGGTLSDDWHKNFIQSIGSQIDAGKPLSTKQGATVLKLIDKVHSHIVKYGWASDTELDRMQDQPEYRLPLYESTSVPKEVRYLGDNLLAFRFKGKDLSDQVKALTVAQKTTWLNIEGSRYLYETKTKIPESIAVRTRFDWLYKVWIVPVYRFNIQKIIDLIASQRFGIDQMAADYLKLARKSVDQPSLFAIDPELGIIVANVCDNPILAGWITEIAEGVRL